MKEIEEYKEYEKTLKDLLESQYYAALVNDDMEQAYTILGKLMSHKLISTDDPRIDKNNELYTKAGIEKSHRFRHDYRTDQSYIPEWVFGDIRLVSTFDIDTIEHMGKRVEGAYEGDAVFPSHKKGVRARLCENAKIAESSILYINKSLGKHNSTVRLSSDEITLIKEGVYRLINFEINGNSINGYKTLGSAIIRIKGGTIIVSLYLSYNSFIMNWIPIKETIEKMVEAIKDMIHNDDIEVHQMPKADDWIENQQRLIKELKVN